MDRDIRVTLVLFLLFGLKATFGIKIESPHLSAVRAFPKSESLTRLITTDGEPWGHNVTLVILENIKESQKNISFSVDSFLISANITIGYSLEAPNVTFPEGISFNSSKIINNGTAMLYQIHNLTTGPFTYNVKSAESSWYTEVIGSSLLNCDFDLYRQYKNQTEVIQEVVIGNPVIKDTVRLYLSFNMQLNVGILTELRLWNATTGEILSSHNLTELTHDPTGFQYRTDDIVIPTKPFYVEARGVDFAGIPIQRILANEKHISPFIKPSYLRIVALSNPDAEVTIYPGRSVDVNLTITNQGPEEYFHIIPSTFSSFVSVSNLIPNSVFQLSTNKSINTTATISISADIDDHFAGDIALSVVYNNSRLESNYVIMKLFVPEISSPNCRILTSSFNMTCLEVKGSTVCSNRNWSSEMNVYEQDPFGVEIYKTQTGSGEVIWTSKSSTDGFDNTTTINATGSCCVETVTFTAKNYLGKNGQCVLERLPTPKPSGPLSVGAIVGIVVGGVIVVVVVGVVFFKLIGRRRENYENL